jgi:hypothetical protein
MVVPMADLGNEDRSNLTPFAEPVLIKRRTVALIVLCVVYHLPLLWRNQAALLMGCLGVFRTRIGTGSDEAVAVRWAASARRFLIRCDARMAFLVCVLVGAQMRKPVEVAMMGSFDLLTSKHSRLQEPIFHRMEP